MTAKELREQRAKLIKQARDLRDKCDSEKRDMTAEERQTWDKIMGGVSADGQRVVGEEERLKNRIDEMERLESLESEMRSGREDRVPGRDNNPNQRGDDGNQKATEQHRALALTAWMRAQSGMELLPEHEEACRMTGIKPTVKELPIRLPTGDYRRVKRQVRSWANGEQRAGTDQAQQSLTLDRGGALVPEGFMYAIESALLQFGGPRQFATIMRTETGNPLPWPTSNDTTVKGARIAENTTVTGGDLTFGVVTFNAYKYSSKLILVPAELMNDSAFDLASFIGDACGTRIGRIQADEFTISAGSGAPAGIVSASTAGKTATSATAIAADDLYDLKHSVDPAYREMGVAWSMHDNIFLAVKKLKDGMGRYLWQASLAGGAPDTLDGDPIFINQSMDSTISSGKKTVLYGQHSKFVIRDVGEIRLRRLVERYADSDQEGFVAFMRSDAQLLDAGTHPVKHMVH